MKETEGGRSMATGRTTYLERYVVGEYAQV